MALDEVVSQVGLWWPAADEDALQSAAAAWDRAAGELDRAAEVGRAGAAQARSTWSGEAADRFTAAWVGHETALHDDAAGCRALAEALRRYARPSRRRRRGSGSSRSRRARRSSPGSGSRG